MVFVGTAGAWVAYFPDALELNDLDGIQPEPLANLESPRRMVSKARHLEIQILGDECAYFDGDLVRLMKLLAGCVEDRS